MNTNESNVTAKEQDPSTARAPEEGITLTDNGSVRIWPEFLTTHLKGLCAINLQIIFSTNDSTMEPVDATVGLLELRHSLRNTRLLSVANCTFTACKALATALELGPYPKNPLAFHRPMPK